MKYAITVGLMSIALLAQAQTSEDNAKLRDALKRFPRADANGDGVLTLEEAKAFKENKNKPARKDGRGDGIQDSYTYKTVGKDKLHLVVDIPKGHDSKAKVPAIVFFHGGGFRNGSVNQFQQQAEYLARRGMVAIRVRYRLINDKNSLEIKDCIEDAISAMRWVRDHAGKLGVDPDRIAASGGSAGGYLAAATLLIDFVNAKTDPRGVSAKPNALVLFNPGFGSGKGEGSDSKDPDSEGDLRKYVTPKQPPMINFYGTEDKLLADAKRFEEIYKKAGNRFELLTYPGEGHSFFNKDKYLGPTLAETDKFLVGLGWLTSKAKTP